MRRFIILTLVFLLPCFALGQYKVKTRPQDIQSVLRNSAGMGRGLVSLIGLDPSRFRMSQSYQMGYMSMGGQGFSQGLYLNTISYQFSIPLTLSLQWGLANQPFSGVGLSPIMKSGPFISGARLQYQPSQKTTIQLEFRQLPYSTPYGMYNRNSLDEW